MAAVDESDKINIELDAKCRALRRDLETSHERCLAVCGECKRLEREKNAFKKECKQQMALLSAAQTVPPIGGYAAAGY